MELGNVQTIEQKQILSQTQIQALEILAMDNVALSEMMQNEFLMNPLIEHLSGAALSADQSSKIEEFHPQIQKSKQGDSHKNTMKERDAVSEEKNRSFQDDIYNIIMTQVDLKLYTKNEITILKYLVECLDERGFFLEDTGEIAKAHGVCLGLVEDCLEDLRRLEPYGIFAKNLQHSLLIQLKMRGVENQILEKIIKEHLKEISEGKIGVISRNLKISTSEVREAIAIIVTLNPRPMMNFGESKVQYVTPDIIFKVSHDVWTVDFNDNWMGNYSLSDFYLKMMCESKDEELTEYFKKNYERAKFLVTSIEQRRNTILLISNAIASRQTKFLQGKGELIPMLMSEIAAEINVHTSTVSRAIKDKYLQCPVGTLQMKKLFSVSINANGKIGLDTTASAIKARIKNYVEQEDKNKPLSDQKIADMLIVQGTSVSRRAIAKYRDELGIAGSSARKRV